MTTNKNEPDKQGLKLDAPRRLFRRYLPSWEIEPEELSPFGITEGETGAKAIASSFRNFNTFNLTQTKQLWIALLNEQPSKFLNTDSNLDDATVLSEELDRNADMIGIPLREPDPYYIGRDTYITLTKEREVQRFSSHPSLGIFSPTNPIRQAAVSIVCSAQFQALIVGIVILDFLALIFNYTDDPIINIAGELFFAIYCAEIVLKLIAYGFVIDSHSFLRNGHRIVELIVVASNVVPVFAPTQVVLKPLRVIRAIRLFRLIGALKFTRKIMKTVISSVTDLVPVFVLFVAIICTFSLVSLVFYKSVLLSKCVEINYTAIFNAPGKQASVDLGSEVFYESYMNWTDNSDNWKKINDVPIRCTIFHGSADSKIALFEDKHKRECPSNSSCMITSTGNPDMGFTSYDTLMLSMISTLRLLCQDWWDNLYITIALTNGAHMATVFFLLLIFLGSHYVLNLVLSTISLAYTRNEESDDANMEESVKLAVIVQINRDNELRRQVEVYNVLLDQGRTLLTGPKYLRNLPEDPVPKSSELETYVNTYVESYRKSEAPFKLLSKNNPVTEPETVRSSSGSQTWLDQVLRSIVVRNRSDENLPIDTFINTVILMNAIEMLVITPVQKQSLQLVENNNVLYTIIFTFEALLKLRYQRTYYLKSVMNQFDLGIVIVCLIEMMVPFADSRMVMVLRMTRFLRLFKLARVSKDLERLITVVLQSFTSEIPLIIVSFTIVIISAGIGMVMFQETYHKYKQYQKPTQNFVDIYNSIILVFRIMCGEWIENLWVCMKIMESGAEKGFCVVYFLINQIIVSLVIFKLYIGILLNKFSEFRAKAEEEKQNEQGKNDHEENGPRHRQLTDRVKRFLKRAFGINLTCPRRSNIETDEVCFGSLRAALSAVVGNSSGWFGIYIIVMTILSSSALILDDYYLTTDPALRKICDHLEVIFLAVFGTEMLLKVFAYGLIEYCKSPWRILDAAIVITTLADMIVTHVKMNEVDLTVMRVFRTLRCLRILRTANVWQGFKLIIGALFRSVRRLLFAFVIVVIVWLMFALVSISLFSHKFYRCVDDTGSVLPKSIINNKTECLQSNNTWQNKRINFDSTSHALLALLEISVFKGWIDIFQDISNAPIQIDLQPDIDNNTSPLVLIYILFIVIGSFFMIGLLIGVIVDSFEEERKAMSNAILTEGQQKMQNTLKQCLMFPLNSTKPKPDGWLSQCLYELNNTVYVDVFYLVLILTSTVVIALQYYPGNSELVRLYLPIIDDVLLLCFVLEIVMKILAEGTQYLVPFAGWNLVDFVIVVLSAMAEVSNQTVGLQFLRIIRFARVLRMGRLLAKSTNIKTVRDIVLAMVTTLPSMFNMIALLFMTICIFAIVGVNLFSSLDGNGQPPFNEYFSFRTFFTTWRMLFIVSTSAGFNDYLDGSMRFPWPYSAMSIAFWVTYLCLSFFVVTNLIVSAVVSSYNEVFDSESSTVKLQTAEAFTKMWNNFDQSGTGKMHAKHISELLDLVSEPLRIQQPNSGVIGIMMIPMSENYYVSHEDMAKTLINEILDHMGIEDEDEMQDDDLHRPIMDTMIMHKLRTATQVIKIAWWQRKIRHHVVDRLQGKELGKMGLFNK